MTLRQSFQAAVLKSIDVLLAVHASVYVSVTCSRAMCAWSTQRYCAAAPAYGSRQCCLCSLYIAHRIPLSTVKLRSTQRCMLAAAVYLRVLLCVQHQLAALHLQQCSVITALRCSVSTAACTYTVCCNRHTATAAAGSVCVDIARPYAVRCACCSQ
jgi:hypothetical protein